MGKFISNFDTTAELASFSATTGFEEPHVSLTKDTLEVHFFKDPCKSEIVKTTYELIDLGLPSGTLWANKNIGASSETDSGQYFQWGDINGFTAGQVTGTCKSKSFDWANYKYSDGTESGTTKYQGTGEGKDGLVTLEAVDDAAIINMHGNWRMPTEAEFTELLNGTTNAWVTDYQGSGVNGRLFTSKANGKTLFFPAAGSCNGRSVDNVGSSGSYWSSSLGTSNVIGGRRLGFRSGGCNIYYDYRCYGFSVRGVVGQ